MSQALYNFTKNPPYPQLLMPGVPAYAFGSKNANAPIVRMQISKVQISSNVAILTVQMLEGLIPSVGDLATISGTSVDASAFNTGQSPVALTVVSINAITGAGTIRFALTGSDFPQTADAGQVSVGVSEVPYLGGSAFKSQAFALQAAKSQGRGISWGYETPSAPGSLSIQLEGAINDNDGEYTLIGTAQTGTSGWTEILATAPENVNFVRLNVTTFSAGTAPSIIGKISQS